MRIFEGFSGLETALPAPVMARVGRSPLRSGSWPARRTKNKKSIVFAHTSAKYIVRSETLDQLTELRPRIYRCFEAGALAADMRHDEAMAALYRRNSEALGRPFP